MLNARLISKVVNIVIKEFEKRNFNVDILIIYKQVVNWYTNSDITDAFLLAAAVIQLGDYNKIFCYSDVTDAYDCVFGN